MSRHPLPLAVAALAVATAATAAPATAAPATDAGQLGWSLSGTGSTERFRGLSALDDQVACFTH